MSPRYRRGFEHTRGDVIWRQFLGNIALESRLIVYTCDKSCIRERDKNRIKNGMYKRAYRFSLVTPILFLEIPPLLVKNEEERNW